MKKVALLLGSILILTSCGGGGGSPKSEGGGSEGTNPYVAYMDIDSTSPVDGETNLPVDTEFVVVFTKAVDLNSVITNDGDPSVDTVYLENSYGDRVEIETRSSMSEYLIVKPVFDLEVSSSYQLVVEGMVSSSDGDTLGVRTIINITTSSQAGTNPGNKLGVSFTYDDYNYNYDVVKSYNFGSNIESRLDEDYALNGRLQNVGNMEVVYEGAVSYIDKDCQSAIRHQFSTELDMSLTQGNIYFLGVQACNDGGCGAWSTEMSFEWDGTQAINKAYTPGTGEASSDNYCY